MNILNDIQPTVRTDIRTDCKMSRIHLILAGSGIVGAMCLSSLFGGVHSTHKTHTQEMAKHVQTYQVQKSAQPLHMEVETDSYRVANSYVDMARQAAINAGINPDAFVRQIQQESGFNPSAGSPAGAVGIAQFMPATAASMGVNPYDPASALPGAARLMAGLAAQFGGDYRKALAAYNAGPGAVIVAVSMGGANWLAYTPTETQNYVAIIMG